MPISSNPMLAVLGTRPVAIESENALTPPWINALLRPLFALDVWSARHLRPPFGEPATRTRRSLPRVVGEGRASG